MYTEVTDGAIREALRQLGEPLKWVVLYVTDQAIFCGATYTASCAVAAHLPVGHLAAVSDQKAALATEFVALQG